ncbi:MAG: hypothetical protein MAG451_00837 [Anaerolineales bacterium]|nr:hypothetical protein [Anaerolineales bacterium]
MRNAAHHHQFIAFHRRVRIVTEEIAHGDRGACHIADEPCIDLIRRTGIQAGHRHAVHGYPDAFPRLAGRHQHVGRDAPRSRRRVVVADDSELLQVPHRRQVSNLVDPSGNLNAISDGRPVAAGVRNVHATPGATLGLLDEIAV